MNTFDNNSTSNILWIRRLVWTYFFLLIFEGSLRKWVIPSLSSVLLVIRDPIVIAIYIIALQARIFPRNCWVTGCILLAGFCLFAGLFTLQGDFSTALYGIHADFLHLPLIFLIPKVFDIRDVKKIGLWVLTLCIPMGLLMAVQFEAPSSSWLNAGAGGDASQISGGMGHIRPAGTFSFINGVEGFFALAAAFLLYCLLAKPPYSRWLLIMATFALLVGASVSSSRGTGGVLLVDLSCAVFAGIFLQPALISPALALRTIQGICVIGLVLGIATQFSVFGEGLAAFQARLDPQSGSASVLLNRAVSDYTNPMDLLADTPIFGRGLGLGTNAGVALSNGGQVGQILAEGEWSRVILESGPLLGGIYLALRVILVAWMGWKTAQTARRGNVLPFLLFGSSVPLLLGGQFGQPSELGFAVLGGGLTLAAMNAPPLREHLHQVRIEKAA